MRSLTTLEVRRHGDTLFPLATYSLNYPKDSIVLDLHWHSELEFLIVTKGCGIFYLDENEIELEEGDGVIINGGTLHRAKTKSGRSCSFIAVVVDPNLISGANNDRINILYINPVLNYLAQQGKILKSSNEDDLYIINILKEIDLIAKKKSSLYELEIKIELLKIFSILFKSLGKEIISNIPIEKKSNKKQNIKDALLFMHKNYEKSLSLRDISSAASMSEAYFCRTFKALVGKTVFEYLNFYRINTSLSLLKDSDKPISIVSEEVGFENISYFIKIFKKMTGVTPKVYRTKNN